jgi:tRNA-Thr(GGU) m(6)t(6)A37 methyltransferase TsaA
MNKSRTFDFDEESHDIVEVGNTFGLQIAEGDASGLVAMEVSKFKNNNGFINIFLVNEQFMDRVQKMVKKKSVSNKDSFSQSETEQSFCIKPIAYLESCFREKFGTPRQSGFVKNAKARLTLVNEINSSCLEGLQDFGYVWLIFVFHVGLNDHNNQKTKIKPPKLDGEKKGVFATRSPHRYNPIGLSIAKLDKIENRTVWVSGIDLIHGTPIIDIKPYHYLDSLP